MLDLHELAAGKLSALFSRSASRDLYDVSRILARNDLDQKKLRLGFVAYGAMSRRDWRTVSVDDVDMSSRKATIKLLPLLRSEHLPGQSEVEAWSSHLVDRCRELLSNLLPFEPAEQEFLERINGHGEIRPDLLTEDSVMQEKLAFHPALLWKAQNVRDFRPGDA